MLHYSYQGIRKITNYEERQWYFLLSTTIRHWHSTTLMGLNQAVSTGKPVAKYSYQRHACFLKEEFSHPERSNKIPGLLQNNPFVDFLSAKLKLMHSDDGKRFFSSWSHAVSSESCFLCWTWIWWQCAWGLVTKEMTLRATELAAASGRGAMAGCFCCLYLSSYGWGLISSRQPLVICLIEILQSISVMLVNAGHWIYSITDDKNGEKIIMIKMDNG